MKNEPYVIGLTGNIATGKSSVMKRLRQHGALVIDADEVAHAVMEPGGEAYDAVVEEFGRGILAPDGSIDRRKLGAIVFGDPTKLRKLEKLVHPAVRKRLKEAISHAGDRVVVVEAIKLLDYGLADEICDEVWVVTAPPRQQALRLMRDRGLSEEEAWLRIDAQPPQEEKVRRADVVIRNDGSIEELHEQVDEAWNAVVRRLQTGGRTGR